MTTKVYELLKVSDSASSNALLRQKSKKIKSIDAPVRELAEFMVSQLGPTESVGLAAPQFEELVRLIVVRFDTMTDVVIVNPEIVKERGEHFVVEGCRSIPGEQYKLKRPKIIKVKGLSLEGKEITVKGRDLLAQVLRHEIDHLDGVLIDSIGKLIT